MIANLLLLNLLGWADALAAPAPELELQERGVDLSNSGWVVRHDLLQNIKHLDKRQSSQAAQLPPASICGYLFGSPDNQINCAPGVCGYNTQLDVFMCCSSQAVQGGTTYPVGCPTVTSCVPSTAMASCTGSCLTNPLVTICSNNYAPECGVATIAGISQLHLTDYACLASKTTVPVYLTTLDPAAVSSIALGGSSAPASPAKSSLASSAGNPTFQLTATTTVSPGSTHGAATITTGPTPVLTGTPTLSTKTGTAVAQSAASQSAATVTKNDASSPVTMLSNMIYALAGMMLLI